MQVWIFAICIGALAGFLTPAAWFLLDLIQTHFRVLTIEDPFLLAIFLPGFTFISIYFLFFVTKAYRSADGFTYFISDIHYNDGSRNNLHACAHGVASFLLLMGGGVVGIEGFIFEILSAIGGKLGTVAKMPSMRRKTLAACGLTAGFAALLAQPAAALIFTIELFYLWGGVSSLGPLAVSAYLAASTSQSLTSPTGIFRALVGSDNGLSLALRGESFHINGMAAIFCIVIIGGAAALFAAFSIWLYRQTDRVLHELLGTRRASDISTFAFTIRLAMWAIVTGIVFYIFPDALGSGVKLLQSSLWEGFAFRAALFAIIVRLFMGVLGYTVFGSVGLILPTLVLGGLLGSGLSTFFGNHFMVSSGTLALLGMGAFFSAAFGAPVTATVLVYGYAGGVVSENIEFLFTALIANFAANMICGLFQTDRMATMGLYRHKIRFRNGMCFNTLSSITVRDAMLPWVSPISKESSMGETYRQLMESRFLKLPVVDKDKKLVGLISLGDFYGLDTWRKLGTDSQVPQLLGLEGLVKASETAVTPELSLEEALKIMGDEEIVPVVESSEQVFAGILLKSDLVNLYNKEVVKKAFRR